VELGVAAYFKKDYQRDDEGNRRGSEKKKMASGKMARGAWRFNFRVAPDTPGMALRRFADATSR
jgi:hypothetical protein